MITPLSKIKNDEFVNRFSNSIVLPDQCNSFYAHTTLVIKTIEDYISVIDYLQDESVFIE